MNQESNKSKRLLVNLRHGALLCAALMLISCSHLSNSNAGEGSATPLSSDLQKRLAAGDYAAVILVGGEDGISVFAGGGKDITAMPCGRVAEDGTILQKDQRSYEKERLSSEAYQCDLNGIDLLNVKNIGVYTIKQNPACITIPIGSRLYSVHAGGDAYPRGAYPCHANH